MPPKSIMAWFRPQAQAAAEASPEPEAVSEPQQQQQQQPRQVEGPLATQEPAETTQLSVAYADWADADVREQALLRGLEVKRNGVRLKKSVVLGAIKAHDSDNGVVPEAPAVGEKRSRSRSRSRKRARVALRIRCQDTKPSKAEVAAIIERFKTMVASGERALPL